MFRITRPNLQAYWLAAAIAGAFSLSPLSPAAARDKVVVYTVIPETEVNRQIDEEFTRRTDIDVELLSIPAVGTVASRIRSEKGHPRADVFAAAPIDFQQSLAKDGLLLAYKALGETDAVIKHGYADPEGYWHGWYGMTTAIFWNTKRFEDDAALKGVTPPSTWDGLLDPKLKGQVILANPQTSAIGYVLLATQIFRLGEAKAWDYTTALNANVAQYTPSAPLTVTLVEQGEGAVGAFWLGDILNAKIARKQPLGFIVPQNNVVNVWAASIVKGGPNPEGAKKYIDFLETDYAQSVNAKYGFRNPLLPGVAPPEGAPALESIQAVNYDMAWATDNMDRVRKAWARVADK